MERVILPLAKMKFYVSLDIVAPTLMFIKLFNVLIKNRLVKMGISQLIIACRDVPDTTFT